MRHRHGPLHDEQGDWSFSRIALMIVIGFTLGLIGAASFYEVHVPSEAWTLLGATTTGLMAWAGGRAIARYLGPQVARVAQAVAGAGKKAEPFVPHEWTSGDPNEGVV